MSLHEQLTLWPVRPKDAPLELHKVSCSDRWVHDGPKIFGKPTAMPARLCWPFVCVCDAT